MIINKRTLTTVYVWWFQQTFSWYQSPFGLTTLISFLLYGFRILLSSSSFQHLYDHNQTFFLQLSYLEKPISPSSWESRHAGLCWWNYSSTTSLWIGILLNTQTPNIWRREQLINDFSVSCSPLSPRKPLLLSLVSPLHMMFSLRWKLRSSIIRKLMNWDLRMTCNWWNVAPNLLLSMPVPSKQFVTNFMLLADPSRTLIKCTGSFEDSTLIF